MSVIIDGEHWPFGVLSIHTTRQRTFTQNDIHFLQAIANLLATAIAHKRATEALHEAHARLETRVKERTADLQALNKELQTFTYMISHDLRAPLVNIKGFAGELSFSLETVHDVIKDLLPQLNDGQRLAVTTAFESDIPEAMGFINSSVNRMNDFINAILKLSRLGRRELNLEPLDMQALTQSTLETLAHQIEQRRVKVTVGQLPPVVADRTSLEQVLGNILMNAVLYLDPQRPGEIEITGERQDKETVFYIRDNGRGIALEDLPKVFELFRRVGNQDVPGEGMGLAYVRALLRRCGGRIWCDSAPGIGSTFGFTIPHHQPAPGEENV
jgi:signal transduction histidine kinase